MRTPALSAALSALLIVAGPPAAAQAPAAPAASAAARVAMDLRQIVEHVVSLGYRDVKEVERKSDKLFEVKTRDPQGAWVELHIDSRSGEILRRERDR